jgi:hypothetical protein
MEMQEVVLTIAQAFLTSALDAGNFYPLPFYLLRGPIGWKEKSLCQGTYPRVFRA